MGGEAGAAVADLGEQPRGADAAGAGQTGEYVRVGVRVELVSISAARVLICWSRVSRTATKAQVFDLVRADPHDGQTGGEQGVDDRSVRAFDRHLAAAGAGQHGDQLAQAGCGVFDAVPEHVAAAAAGVHDGDGVVVSGPVQAPGHAVGRLVGQCRVRVVAGRLPARLFAASSSGEAPAWGAGGAGAWLPVRSLIGARRRSALSTVRTSRATARSRGSHDGHQPCQASWAIWRHLGRISDLSEVTDRWMVHQ